MSISYKCMAGFNSPSVCSNSPRCGCAAFAGVVLCGKCGAARKKDTTYCLECRDGVPPLVKEPESVAAAIARETPVISDHALAAAELLQQVCDRLMAGTPPEDLGQDVQRFGRMMERKI